MNNVIRLTSHILLKVYKGKIKIYNFRMQNKKEVQEEKNPKLSHM